MKSLWTKHPFKAACLLFMAWLWSSGGAFAQTTYTVPVDFSTIQAAVDFAAPGDIIQVNAGTYVEEVTIDKSLTLRGDPGSPTVIGPGPSAPTISGNSGTLQTAFTIEDGVDNVIIEGFVIKEFSDVAIVAVDNNDNIRVRDNEIENSVGALGILSAVNTVDLYFTWNKVVSGGSFVLNLVDGSDHLIRFNDFEAFGNGLGYASGFVVSAEGTDAVSIRDNEIDVINLPDDGSVIRFNNSAGALVVSDNIVFFDGSASANAFYGLEIGIVNDLVVTRNIFNGADNSGGGSGIWFLTSVPALATIDINSNYFVAFSAGVSVQGPIATGNGIVVKGNSFTCNAGVVNAGGPAGAIDASGNYWGSIVSATVNGLMTGNVDFSPYLASDYDTDLSTEGFQSGFDTLYVDLGGLHLQSGGRIQEAVDYLSSTQIYVNPGVYNESTNIDRALTITGDRGNVMVAGPDPAAAVLDGQNVLLTAFNVDAASGVTIEGLFITGYEEPAIALLNGCSNIVVRDNEITSTGDVATALFSDNAQAVEILLNVFNSSSPGTLYLLDGNVFIIDRNVFNLDGNGRPYIQGHALGSFQAGNVFFYRNDVSVNNPADDGSVIALSAAAGDNLVNENTITYTGTASVNAFHGIEISNVATQNITVSQNIIDANDLDGEAYGVWLLNDIPFDANIVIQNNFLTGFDYGVGVNAPIVTGNSVVIYDNDLSGNGLAVRNEVGGGELNASFNWFGSNVETDVIAEIAGDVDFTPYYHSAWDISSAFGFQGNRDTLHVTDAGLQIQAVGRIQEAVDALESTQIYVEDGTYNEATVIGKSNLTVTGDRGSVTEWGPAPVAALIDGLGTLDFGFFIQDGAADVTIEGLNFEGFLGAAVGTFQAGDNLRIRDNRIATPDIDGAGAVISAETGSLFFTWNIVEGNGDYGINVVGNTGDVDVRFNHMSFNGTGVAYFEGVVINVDDAPNVNFRDNRSIINNPPADGTAYRFNDVAGATTFERDTLAFAGTPASGAFGGIDLSGNLGSVLVADSDLDGGNAAGGGYGVRFFDNIPDASPVVIRNNFINGFGAAFGSFQDLGDNAIDIFDNDLSGNTVGSVYLDPAGLIDASRNWWGSNDAVAVAAEVDNNIDYTPWLDEGTDSDVAAGFQPLFDVLWVDDDSPQTGSLGRVQEAVYDVNPTGLVNVLDGRYIEHIEIDRPLTLRGDRGDVTVAGVGPAAPIIDGDLDQNAVNDDLGPVVNILDGITDVTIEGFIFENTTENTIQGADGNDRLTLWDNEFRHQAAGLAVLALINANDLIFNYNVADVSDGSTTTLFTLEVDNAQIQNNVFSLDGTGVASAPGMLYQQLEGSDLSFAYNDITVVNPPVYGMAFASDALYGESEIMYNNYTVSGSPADFFGFIYLAGETGTVYVYRNDLDGGGVSGDAFGVWLLDNLNSDAEIYIQENFINGFGTAVGAVNALTSGITVVVRDNDISGNSLYGVANLAAGSAMIDASRNWWGDNDDDAVKPLVGSPDMSIDFSPWFHYGTDVDAVAGFQPDYSYLHIDDDSPIAGLQGRVQEAHDLLSGANLHIYMHSTNYPASYYDESANLTQTFTLIGDDGDYPVVTNVAITGANQVDVVDVNLVVEDVLTLTDGIFTTESDNEIYAWNRDETAIVGFSDISYVQGRIRRNINATGSYDFPVGTSGKGFQLANVEFTVATTTDNLLVYFDETPGALLDFECVCSSKFYDVLDNGRWYVNGYDAALNPVTGDGEFNVTAYNQNFTPFVPAVAPAKYVVTRGNIVGSTLDCTTNPATVTRTGYTDFSETFYFTAAGDDSTFPAPDIDVDPGTTVCEGDAITLTASTPYIPQEFYWSLPDGGTFIGAELVVSPITLALGGTYTVYALINDCPSDEATVDITVNPAPAPPTLIYNGPICTGAQLVVEVDNPITGEIYYITHPNGIDVYQGSVVIDEATVADAGTYTAYTESPDGCLSLTTSFIDVVVYPVPVTPEVDAPTVCEGSNLVLTVTNPITVNNPVLDFYEWFDADMVQLPEDGPVLTLTSASASWDGLVYRVVAYENGCPSDTAYVTLSVNVIPDDPTLDAPATVCEGANFVVFADNTTAQNYDWFLNSFYLATTTDPELLTSIEVGGVTQNVTLSVIAYNGPCQSSEVSTTILVEAAPPIPTITGAVNYCVGQTLELTADSGPGYTNYTWVLPGGGTVDAATVTISDLTLADDGIYAVVVYAVDENCDRVWYVDVSVDPQPFITDVTYTDAVCQYSPITFNVTGTDVISYNITGPNGFDETNATGEFEITSADFVNEGTYTITVVNGFCTDVTTVDVDVKLTPSAPTVSSNSPVCQDGTIILNASSAGADLYYWTGPDGFDLTTAATSVSILNADGDNAGTYSVWAIADGCTSTVSTVDVDVFTRTLSITTNAPVNEGDVLTLTAEGTAADDATSDFTWFDPDGNVYTTTGATLTIAAADPAIHDGTWFVQVSVGVCTFQASVNVDVVPAAQPIVAVVSKQDQACPGLINNGRILIGFLDAIPDTIRTRLITVDAFDNVLSSTPFAYVNVYENLAPGYYRVEVIGDVGMTVYPYLSVIQINAFIPTSIDAITPSTTTALVTWTPQVAATGYQLRYRRLSPSPSGWITVTLGNITSFTLTGLTPDAAYQIQVRGRCANGTYTTYSGLTNFFTDPLSRLAGATSSQPSETFNLYPNPNRGQFTVSATLEYEAEGTITMTDLSGRTVHRQAVSFGKGENVIPVNVSVASGMYLVQIQAGAQTRSVRVSVE